jgi:hypothetical protein
LSVDSEGAGLRGFQSADEAQKRRLAAAGGTEQGKNVGEIEIRRDIVDHGVIAVAFGELMEMQEHF